MRKIKGVICAVFAVCALSGACLAGAMESVDTGTVSVNGVVAPLAERLAINRAITSRSEQWVQSRNFTSYRVWVANTTTNQMKVTVTEPSGNKRVFYVAAGGNKYIDVNDATYGVYTVSFDSGSVTPTGTVRVKMSTVSLS